jgi:hypothetical protein
MTENPSAREQRGFLPSQLIRKQKLPTSLFNGCFGWNYFRKKQE